MTDEERLALLALVGLDETEAAEIVVRLARARDITHVADVQPTVPDLLTIEEAAAICKVHHQTIRRAIRNEGLPAFRLGAKGALRVKPEELEGWLESRRATAAPRPLPSPVGVPPGRLQSARRRPSGGRLSVKDLKD